MQTAFDYTIKTSDPKSLDFNAQELLNTVNKAQIILLQKISELFAFWSKAVKFPS